MTLGAKRPSFRRIQTWTCVSLVVSFVFLQVSQSNSVEGEETANADVASSETHVVDSVSVQRAKQALSDGDENDLELRLNLARAYLESQRYEDSLREFLQVIDPSMLDNPTFGKSVAQNSRLWRNLETLSDSHPPTKGSLVEQRDSYKEKMLTLDGPEQSTSYVQVYSRLNEFLNDESDVAASILKLNSMEKSPTTQTVLVLLVNENLAALIEQGHSKEIAEAIDVEQFAKYDLAVRQLMQVTQEMFDPSSDSSVMDAKHTRDRVSLWYRLLVMANKPDDAQVVANRLLEHQDDAETYHVLAKTALDVNKATKSNVEQARKATELEPNEVAYLVTLIKLLHTLGESEEAADVAQAYLDSDPPPYRSRRIQETIDSLK